MKAIQMNQFGGPEVLKLTDLKLASPKKGEALVEIKAAGVNFIDIYQRKGIYPVPLPYILGLEAAGIVESVGEEVKHLKAGDRVAYVHEPGAYAQKSLVAAEHLIPIPQDFSFEEAAAFPLQGMTAHYLIHEFRKITPNDTVLIHAAAGGMGLLLVQWAKHLGAYVIGTVSNEEKARVAQEAGADAVIIYTKQDFASEVLKLTNQQGVDLIIDGVGKTTFPGNLEAVAVRGNIIIFGAASGPADPISPNILMKKSITLSGGTLFNFLLNREELMKRAEAVIEGIQQRWLKMRIDQVFPLKEASEAHQKLEGRNTMGKILLKP